MLFLLLLAGDAAPSTISAQLDSFAVELALDGSYHDTVIADEPVGFWLLNEQLATTGVREFSGSGLTGTYNGGLTFGARGPFPHGGTAPVFNGTNAYVDVGDESALEFTSAFSAECFFKTTSSSIFMGLMGKGDSENLIGGWRVHMESGRVAFYAETAAGAIVFYAVTPLTYNDGLWHHCVCTWNGETGGAGEGGAGLLLLVGGGESASVAGVASIYIDGVSVVTVTPSAGTIGTPARSFAIGATTPTAGFAAFLSGSIAGVAAYDSELTADRVAAHYASTQWTDVTADVLTGPTVSMEYGTQGMGPLDRMADSGMLDLSLNNSHLNSAGLAGYYSPNHANARAGFTFDIPIRVQLEHDGETYTKFWGRIAAIDPEPGQYRSRQTHVFAHDYQFLLVDTDVRRITPQIGKTETELIRAVFDAMPHTAQPMELELDASVDIYSYAFDDLEGGRKAATAINNVLISAWGRGFTTGDGTFRYSNRQAAIGGDLEFEVDDAMIELESPSDRSHVFNDIRVITHPKSIDAAATSVLFSHPTTEFVAANGGTLELWGDYRHPTNDAIKTGGTDMVTPVSGTDFIANANEDGSGANLTASVTVTADYFSSTAKFILTNNHATLGAYFTTLQARGRGIYDLAPVTSEATLAPANRALTIDLQYQHDGNNGKAMAELILNERGRAAHPIDSITVTSHRTATLTQLAVECEPGELLLVSETQTGVNSTQAMIRSVRVEVHQNLIVKTTVGLVPVRIGQAWILDDAVWSELDLTTIPAHG